MPHHPGRVVLEDVAVIHPAARTTVRHPRDTRRALGRQVDDVFPRTPCRWLTVYREHLEEVAVQMERMIHQCGVHDVPDLQFADPHGVVRLVSLSVDDEIDATA